METDKVKGGNSLGDQLLVTFLSIFRNRCPSNAKKALKADCRTCMALVETPITGDYCRVVFLTCTARLSIEIKIKQL